MLLAFLPILSLGKRAFCIVATVAGLIVLTYLRFPRGWFAPYMCSGCGRARDGDGQALNKNIGYFRFDLCGLGAPQGWVAEAVWFIVDLLRVDLVAGATFSSAGAVA